MIGYFQIYLAHPFETNGTIEENVIEEKQIAEGLKSVLPPYMGLVRPFELINRDAPRDEALFTGLVILKECKAILLSGNWKKSKGCIQEFIWAILNNKIILEYKDNAIYKIIPKFKINKKKEKK